jgi:hypothetical protein
VPLSIGETLPNRDRSSKSQVFSATRMTPFEAVYGQNPASVLSYFPGVSKIQAVDQMLTV